MKKKVLLIAAVALFSIGLLTISKGFLKSYTQEPQAVVTQNNNIVAKANNPEAGVKSQEKPKADSTAKPDAAKNTQTEGSKSSEQKPNLTVTDTVNGKTIISGRIDFSGKTVSEATFSLLSDKGIRYKSSGVGEMTYVSMIGNIKERDAGPESGWCYFINGKKYSVGAGTYKLKGDEILEWKFLKDGISQ